MRRLSPVEAQSGDRPLPYGLQTIDEDDVAAVVEALRSPLLASGPRARAFEQAFAAKVGAAEAVACSSGTAALQMAVQMLGLGPGPGPGPGGIVLVPPITFLSTATAPLLRGCEVRFVDVDPETGLMSPTALETALDATPAARAVIPVHLGGRLCDMDRIHALAEARGVAVIEDCCHATGGRRPDGEGVGASARSAASVFSFHPVKTMTTGEGGMVATSDPARAETLRAIRNHCVTRDPERMTEPHSFDAGGQINPWAYEETDLGQNFRMNEMQAALGISQLAKLDRFVTVRRALAEAYGTLLDPYAPMIRTPPGTYAPNVALHLYSVGIDFEALRRDKAEVVRALAAEGVGTQVHYIPIYRQPYMKRRYGEVRLAGAEAYYASTLSLPLFPAMTFLDAERVVAALRRALGL
jgi:dTDP-4-amino-4,6-dideoxygalactose transaminase